MHTCIFQSFNTWAPMLIFFFFFNYKTFNQILITAHTKVFTYSCLSFNTSHICTVLIALQRKSLKDLAFLVLGETCLLSGLYYSICVVLFCQKVKKSITSMKHLAETFPFIYPAVCAVPMNFNSSIILCLSSIDICPPIEFHSLDIL